MENVRLPHGRAVFNAYCVRFFVHIQFQLQHRTDDRYVFVGDQNGQAVTVDWD